MSFKSSIAKAYAGIATRDVMRRAMDPLAAQKKVLRGLLAGGDPTAFGKDHRLDEVDDHIGLQQAVPLRDYEALKPYIDRIVAGEEDVLWPGRPLYLCKTSGTTSGAKYIPITKESLPNHIDSARRALLAYMHHSGKANFVDGKMIFLQGSPVLDHTHMIPTGRLSGIVANHVPSYLLKNRMPGMATNSIPDWESKVEAIVSETMTEDMRLISGIPAWVQMYFERLLARTGKKNVREVFPNFSLFVYGGVNYSPYRSRMETLIGGSVPSIELFPASEGFIAYQDKTNEEGLLLVVDNGIYYGFLELGKEQGTVAEDNATRVLSIAEVKVGVNYALVLYTNAGLWGYEIGDTIKFVSLTPPRIVVTGRTKHYTSAFGEHVIAEEVEGALKDAMASIPCEVAEFTVAPELAPTQGLPFHEWHIEFAALPADLEKFALAIDTALQKRNPYYKDLITGSVLRPLVIRSLPRGTFANWMKARGMNDAQSKVPRLANDRRFVPGE
ncbi:MAG: GH3 auxin-responsive promoter family protein [Flavobacteriales bacterium]|nr:GH3 auxin-responsive promoter family protein [Flavobacteriales bacterium]MBK6944381.1 GH3 auxin-responsive promoter family protein [Flavobacteriales bacterium]MBK7242074.1 GH3 auxin-responsive promoter family protein [Flavobacteriales bacterium]MBK7298035.1 GH3 auxin-responsive promoter family protein [Flavobacteriales bacterium]MBK9534049.1 GH3 auxin-responsive promoter family protein [Flavobacteriales bacterium]